MLQYILSHSERYSAAELAQMAIEGGCEWICVHMPELSDHELKAVMQEGVLDVCREAGRILTIDDRPELAAELGVHGVRLSLQYQTANPATASELREKIGPEAIIGLEVVDPAVLTTLAKADIDFAYLPARFTAEERATFIKTASSALPVVAQGEFSNTEAADTIMSGFKGVAVSKAITDAPDPVAATASLRNAVLLM